MFSARLKVAFLLVCVLSIMPVLAKATPTYTLAPDNPNPFTPPGAPTAHIVDVAAGLDTYAAAGQMRMQILDQLSGITHIEKLWCFDDTTVFSSASGYEQESLNDFLPSAKLSLVGALFAHAGPLVTDIVSNGAFQLALWNILRDVDFDLLAGNFHVVSTSITGVVEEGQAWLANLEDNTWLPPSSGAGYVYARSDDQPWGTFTVVEPKSIGIFMLIAFLLFPGRKLLAKHA